jgi:DNA-directed RNA polymerase subunit N (RpoN/RPB10)
VVLHVDEYEAVRLVDREKLDQEQAAKRMGVSRATCARILESAHQKIAEALVEGKAIRIEGGSFVLGVNRFRCLDCGTLWESEISRDLETPAKAACPSCHSARVLDFARQAGWQPASPWGGRGRHGGPEGFGGPGGYGKGAGRRRWSAP